MATRKRRKRRKNPVSVSEKMYEHLSDFIERAEKLGDTADKLASYFPQNRIGKLLEGFANEIDKYTEEISEEFE